MKSLTCRCMVLLVSTTMCLNVLAQESSNMSENEQIVREFIASWSRLDADELAGYFAEDGTYHNIPSSIVQGRDNIHQFIAGFIRPWDSTDWEIVSLLAEGDVVMVERLDKTVVAGSAINLPCFGYFELQDGKIKMWRDYFDLATYTSALTEALQNN